MNAKRVFKVGAVMFGAGLVAWALALTSTWSARDAASASSSRAAAKEVHAVLRDIEINGLDPAVATSSNPVLIASKTPELDRIVKLGTPGISAAVTRIERSRANGLNEYLLALCVLRISRADLDDSPGGRSYWDNGQQFTRAWRAHLKRVPGEVRLVAASTMTPEEKNARIVKLGTPAIPFVLDEISRGHSELAPCAETLMDGSVELGGQSAAGLARPEWTRENGKRFAELRTMALDAAR